MKKLIDVIKGDITTLKVDAIVNAANSSLLGGGGVDGAIHHAAGAQLLEECRKLNGCKTGEAKLTKGYNLPAKYVIHTVGPVWRGGNENEEKLLYGCYLNSLELTEKHDIKTIAFPNISTGVYSFPKDKAADVAIKSVMHYLSQPNFLEQIIFVCFDNENYNLYKDKLQKA